MMLYSMVNSHPLGPSVAVLDVDNKISIGSVLRGYNNDVDGVISAGQLTS